MSGVELLLDVFMAIVCASSALAAVWGWWTARSREIKRALRDAEVVSIAEYPDGAKKRIVGQVSLLDEALIAPFSGRQCAAFVVVIDDTDYPRETVMCEKRLVSFVIRDQTGRAIVHPGQARLALTLDEQPSWSGDPTPRKEMLVKDKLGRLFNPELTYREGVLEPGALVAVLGRGVVSFDEAADGPNEHQGGYRRSAGQTKVTITGDSRAPVLISNDPSVVLGSQRSPCSARPCRGAGD